MRSCNRLALWALVWPRLVHVVKSEQLLDSPPGVDTWCGKAFNPANTSFDPGGALSPPPYENTTRLTLKIYPRYSYYLSSDKTASFIVDTPVRYYGAFPFKNETFDPETSPANKVPLTHLKIWVGDNSRGSVLVNWIRVPVNASSEVEVSLEGITLREGVTRIGLSTIGNSPDGIQTFYGQTEITILPERKDTGSMTRIDRLHGGLEVRSTSLTNDEWKRIFPFSFYASWSWIFSTLNDETASRNLSTFWALGFNIIHPVITDIDPLNPAFARPFGEFLDLCDELELYVMYDMHRTYQDNAAISTQLEKVQHRPSLLLYTTADEPDGRSDPLNATEISYQHIKDTDPYHPVSILLNCFNYHFADYTSGTDIIIEETCPLIKSSTVSPIFNTPCNDTYGVCGCDDCHVGDAAYPEYMRNPFLDISRRVDNMYAYQDWLRATTQPFKKPVWGLAQGFYSPGSFWERWPTAAEYAVHTLLRMNHGAKGIVSWIYPTSAEIEDVAAKIARVVTSPDVTGLLLGGPRVRLPARGIDADLVDGAAWVGESEMLIVVVNQKMEASNRSTIELEFPRGIGNLEVLFGYDGWQVGDMPKWLIATGLKGLDVSILKGSVLNESRSNV